MVNNKQANKNIFGKNRKSNCNFKRIYDINYKFMSLFKFMSLHLKNALNIKGQANLEGEKNVISFARQMCYTPFTLQRNLVLIGHLHYTEI